jgi:hypothetical protein
LQLASLPDITEEESARSFLQDAKPGWISDLDYRMYKYRAERTIRAAEGDRTNEIVLWSLNHILAGIPIDTKAIEKLSPRTQQQLENLDEQIRLSKDRNAAESARISRESEELAEVKRRVLRQLDILHKLFIDPASIDRIEPYDNPLTFPLCCFDQISCWFPKDIP